jgi:hypothetical protein
VGDGQVSITWDSVSNAKDGKISIGATDMYTSQNVSGVVDVPRERWFAKIRRSLGEWFSPDGILENEDSDDMCCLPRMFRQCNDGVAMWLEPTDCPFEAGAIIAVVNGDVEIDSGENVSDTPPERVAGGGVIRVHNAKSKMMRAPRVRIPVLAGEVVSGLKARHGMISDTNENRLLIRSDTSRRVEALRRDGVPEFVNLRNSDLLLIIMHASNMFWMASEDEMAIHALYGNVYLKPSQEARAAMSRDSPYC